jgi:Tol biopolymer transport system component
MAHLRHARPGLREVWALWGLYGLVAAAVFATYSRLSVQELYHVSENGRTGGASRALVVLNFPTALAAIALVAVVAAQARSRTISWLAIFAVVLCAAVAWPGVVDQADLDAKWSNAIAATGVVLALALTVLVTRREALGPRWRMRGDRVRLVAAVILVLISLPWIAADLGFLLGRWPPLSSTFYSDEWYARLGHARLHRAVHEGHHHGMDGTLLALTAIFLSRTLGRVGPKLRRALGVYLGIMLVYGLANLAQDFWFEQLVKRGVASLEIPSLLVPTLGWSWLILVVLAVAAYFVLFRRVPPGELIGHRRLLWPPACQLGIAALLVIGLAHGAQRHETPLGSFDGIAFAYAPEGTSHLFMTRAGKLVQLTDSDESELAPHWSRDGRLIFQTNRDGDWELYTMSPDGEVRALTDNDSDEGEPRWSQDGERIAFVRDGDIYLMSSSGDAERKFADDGYWPAPSEGFFVYETGSHPKRGIIGSGRSGHLASDENADLRYPAWSPSGKQFAHECLIDDRWHICVTNPRTGSGRVLTHGDTNDFAPAWSPDGTRIAFVSDRDGNDQLFVMRADGTGVVRLTSGQADKDTPAWRP